MTPGDSVEAARRILEEGNTSLKVVAAHIRQSQHTEIVQTTASYVDVLAGSGDLAHARELATRILAYDGSAEAQAILQEHATHGPATPSY